MALFGETFLEKYSTLQERPFFTCLSYQLKTIDSLNRHLGWGIHEKDYPTETDLASYRPITSTEVPLLVAELEGNSICDGVTRTFFEYCEALNETYEHYCVTMSRLLSPIGGSYRIRKAKYLDHIPGIRIVRFIPKAEDLLLGCYLSSEALSHYKPAGSAFMSGCLLLDDYPRSSDPIKVAGYECSLENGNFRPCLYAHRDHKAHTLNFSLCCLHDSEEAEFQWCPKAPLVGKL